MRSIRFLYIFELNDVKENLMLSQQRKDMITILKREVVPYLRSQQFQGSFPHFRRLQSDQIDLITFQFNRHGGSFIIELAQASAAGFQTYWGEQITPQKMTAHDVDVDARRRLGSHSSYEDGIWFSYESAQSEQDYIRVAQQVIASFEQDVSHGAKK
ncbi:DUF4304 domain-containing protein [Exiguobacterium sp. IPCH1]|nr:DUF4304 domain-containing protein [Exiguobacterium sp. IPCI3]TCI78985.1 DUF4304 domain-containing protein [Exiguobacterium sp. IPCH1]TCI81572.1 DUF4304 domain-containing protein [Exiguobacterium sp. IPBC4]